MPVSDLSIVRIGPESDDILRNLFEHYLHDMSEWFLFDTKADGRYAFDTSIIWERGYAAYLAKVGATIAGFALIGSAAEWLGEGTHDVDEFFVLRRFRRSGIGEHMAGQLWSERPGEWLVRAFAANAPAVPFWRSAIASYSKGAFREERRMVNGHPWIYFRFAVTPNEAAT
jgi:predicted acetyltransferase